MVIQNARHLPLIRLPWSGLYPCDTESRLTGQIMDTQREQSRRPGDHSQLRNAIFDFVYLRNVEDKTLWVCVGERESAKESECLSAN